ncbi:MBL fold metallo-hydrolase [Patescibacteria group bacterium]|nr:MBL fold metallo-hydrolase [Patescibacteria group bacterium]
MDEVSISYLKHAFFALSKKGFSIFIDPYQKLGKLTPPELKNPNILLITHEHQDHNNREYAGKDTYVIDHPGEYDISDVSIKGINTYHDTNKGNDRGFNTVFSIDFEDINFMHLGDLGDILSHEQIDELGIVNVLFIPVGGYFTIDAKTAKNIIKDINPHIVIPMHYKIDEIDYPLSPLSEFLDIYDGIVEKVDTLTLKSSDFGEDFETKVIIFNDGKSATTKS